MNVHQQDFETAADHMEFFTEDLHSWIYRLAERFLMTGQTVDQVVEEAFEGDSLRRIVEEQQHSPQLTDMLVNLGMSYLNALRFHANEMNN